MNFTDAPDTPRGREEVVRLKRYITALKEAHQKEINGLLAQARQQARQIAELRMEAGHASATATPAARREPAAKVAEQGTRKAAGQGTNKAAGQGPVRSVGFGLKVEDFVPLSPPPLSPPPLPVAPVAQITPISKAPPVAPRCRQRRAG